MIRLQPQDNVPATAPQLGASPSALNNAMRGLEEKLAQRLPAFLAAQPGITVQVTVDDKLQDMVPDRFDAGLRFGEDVENDMIAVRVDPPVRHLVVATLVYWDRHGRPGHPRDLRDHRCAAHHNLRDGSISPWEFAKNGRELRQRCSLAGADVQLHIGHCRRPSGRRK